MSLDVIKRPIAAELDIFEGRFREAMRSKVALLDKITWYIVQRKGKQVRPMLVLLSARLFGPINEATYTAASLIELLHTASLVHDDVVDDANERRGFFSINALWKNKIAVLVGDFLLSQGLLISVRTGQYKMLEIVSRSVQELAEGDGPTRSILALGYAGWGPGQLESEILANGWLTCDASEDLVFNGSNSRKWELALRSMGIDPLSLSATAGHA